VKIKILKKLSLINRLKLKLKKYYKRKINFEFL
jgi:hypothetical protein